MPLCGRFLFGRYHFLEVICLRYDPDNEQYIKLSNHFHYIDKLGSTVLITYWQQEFTENFPALKTVIILSDMTMSLSLVFKENVYSPLHFKY